MEKPVSIVTWANTKQQPHLNKLCEVFDILKAKIFGKVEATFENRVYSASSGVIGKYYARGRTRYQMPGQ